MSTNTTNPAGSTTADAGTRAGLGADDAIDGHLINAFGGDWDDLVEEAIEHSDERLVINMGPQHPSTHGVMRLVLELDGETVTEARVGIGFLHTGIEKTMEYRTWTQGTTLCTRMDYVTPLFQEATYCLGIERLLNIENRIPERASIIRVLMMELTRISSHFVGIGTGGLELGATTVQEVGFRGRECVMRLLEAYTGLRMNHAYIRPGGVAVDLPADWEARIAAELPEIERAIKDLEELNVENPLLKGRYQNVAELDLAGCMALGVTGPILRSTGYPLDLRKTQPYCGYETYDFDVCVWDTQDAYGRLRVRLAEMWESLKIVRQCIERLKATEGRPVMVDDKKIAWPAQLTVGSDGQGNSLDHIREIMGESMEALIHHFKIVTEGFRVPTGQAYVPVESPKGELGAYLVSDGGTRPYRAHFRDPSFHNLQGAAAMIEGGLMADAVVALASIDPVMGGVDR